MISSKNTITDLTLTYDHFRTRIVAKMSVNFGQRYFYTPECCIFIYGLENETVLKGEYIVDAIYPDFFFGSLIHAHQYAMEVINRFLDKITIISYQPSPILKIYSTTRRKVLIHNPVNILVPVEYYPEVRPAEITNEDLKFMKEEYDHRYGVALRYFREALNTTHPDIQFMYLYSAVERIADINTTEKIIKKCNKCGNEMTIGKAINKAIIEMGKSLEYSASNMKKIKEIRGKLVHGTGKRNESFYEDVKSVAGTLESIAIHFLSKNTGFRVRAFARAQSILFLIYRGIRVNYSQISIHSISMQGSWRFGGAVMDYVPVPSEDENLPEGFLTPDFDPTNPPQLHILAFPDQ
jgi:hypothetical protein